MPLNPDQIRVATGMFFAFTFSTLFIALGYLWFPYDLPPMSSALDRLIFTIRCDFFAIFTFLAGIGSIAAQRFCSEKAIDGSMPLDQKHLAINVRYLQNTLEQCFLMFGGHLTLSTVLKPSEMQIIPVLVTWFIFARIAFWIGYHRRPVYRAFGFASTFYPTAIVFFFTAYRLFF